MELTEFEKKAMEIYYGSLFMEKSPQEFIEDLRKIMPPVCGVEQRKFLDEIEKLEYVVLEPTEEDPKEIGLLCVSKLEGEEGQTIKLQEHDFPTIDLSRVIKGE
jgi:hypothetical protein